MAWLALFRGQENCHPSWSPTDIFKRGKKCFQSQKNWRAQTQIFVCGECLQSLLFCWKLSIISSSMATFTRERSLRDGYRTNWNTFGKEKHARLTLPLTCSIYSSQMVQMVWLMWSHEISSLIIYTLIARVVGALQIISQPLSSIFPVLHCPLGLCELPVCPFLEGVFPPLPLSALCSSTFHCASQDGFGQTWWTGDITIPLQFVSLYDRQELFISTWHETWIYF